MNEDLWMYMIIASIIYYVILFLVIQGASKNNEQTKLQRATLYFLIKLCRAQGVPEEEITEMKKMFGLP